MADPTYWTWGGAPEPVKPTEHIVFYINGHVVTELTMLKDTAGSFVRLAEMDLPAGKYQFSFASFTHEEFEEAMRRG